MANFNPQQLTDKGRELLSRALTEEKAILWSRVSIGNGEFTGDISTIEDLVSSKLDAKLIDSNNLGTVAEVVARFTNETLAEEFEVLELGLFGKLQGDAEEVLYSYSAANDRSILPDMSVPCEIEQTIYTQLENGDAIDVYIDPQLQYLTRDVADALYVPITMCPHGVGDYWITENTQNPATRWAGTIWTKIEGRMLFGADESTYIVGQEGGVTQVTLSEANMPSHSHTVDSHRHRVDSHTHTQPSHTHRVPASNGSNNSSGGNSSHDVTYTDNQNNLYTKSSGGDTTGGASPYTDYQSPGTNSKGSGTAFSILNAYRAVNIWRRTA